MATVHHLRPTLSGPTLAEASSAFLEALRSPGTVRVYRGTLRALAALLGADTTLDELGSEAVADQVAVWFRKRWGAKKPATQNRNLDAIRSAVKYWGEQGWLDADPTRRIQRATLPPDRTRALSRAEVETLLEREDISQRERTLWRMLYETAARASEVLALDVEELDLVNHRARVRRKGGAADVIVWRTGTARQLPRLLKGRRGGPVFLTDRRARVAVALNDLDRTTGRARLSYRRAAEMFEQATGGLTLHQLRHSALTHAAEDGWNTPALMSFSGHTNVKTLARYARVSPEALGRLQAERDPASRRGGTA
jgi:integrase